MTNYSDLPLHNAKGELQAVIETPRGSNIKFCFEVGTQLFGISKFLNVGLVFPCDFGFLPSTRAEDGDPLDIMVFHDGVTFPGLVMTVRTIGVLAVEQREADGKLRNDRIIAVPAQAERAATIAEIDDIGSNLLKQIEVFLRETDEWEQKELKFLGWKRAGAAEKLIGKAAARYAKGGLPAK